MPHPEVPGPGDDEHETTDEAPSRRDLRTIERAIRDRWPMPESVRGRVLNRLLKVLDDDAWEGESPFVRPSHREVIAAARALLAADALNLAQRKLDAARADDQAAEEVVIRRVARRIDRGADGAAAADAEDA
jgi:hypothetical protein